MRLTRSVLKLAAAILLAVAVQPAAAQAQQASPYVSCVKCHALPMRQAMADFRGFGQTQGHGFAYAPPFEMVCQNCHDTAYHEQNPQAPPYPPFFLWRTGGSGSLMANACLGCHAYQPPIFDPLTSHPYDLIPYSGGTTPMAEPPTSVLPLFNFQGAPIQEPYIGGLVCTTCHDPHNPSYPVSDRSKFLRIGSWNDTAALCGYCHTAEATPPTVGYDLVIPSGTDSVRFETLPYGDQQIEVTVRNRGNVSSGYEYADVVWVNDFGARWSIGLLSIPPIASESETVVPLWWMPPPEWSPGAGTYHFTFQQQPLLPDSMLPVEFVRAMYLLPAPTNVRVVDVGPMLVSLAWDAPANPPLDLAWDVYRDGVKITPTPIPYYYNPQFFDGGLAPETPHVYTVVAVRMTTGDSSLPSDPVGATTAVGGIIRVPQDFPTIQAAIDAAYGAGTSIHVAPGTYTEPIMLTGKSGITIKGQDANGCVLDYPSSPVPIDLGYGDSGNTLAGFTIRNNTVGMQAGDVVTECVIVNDFRYTGPAVGGGGLVAQCVLDTQDRQSVVVSQGSALTSVNSIYLGTQPFSAYDLDNATILLLNNDFPYWWGYWDVPGAGNFEDQPIFDAPGLPLTYRPAYYSPTNYRGFPLEDPYFIPDVGAFQAPRPYTPQPPENLTAGLTAFFPPAAHLEWSPSVDDPLRMVDYYVYRSTAPDFEVVPTVQPYTMVPPGMTSFDDFDLVPGETYYYQVRAYGGDGIGYTPFRLISAPTGTASVSWANNPPIAVDDDAVTPEETPVTVPVLANDSDPDPADTLTVTTVGLAANGGTYLNPDDTVTYFPAPGFSGTDSFTYTVSDMFGGTATATVTVTVTDGNQPPVAVNDAYQMLEDTGLSAYGILYNDTDPDGDPLVAELVTGTPFGTLHLYPDGSFFYYAPANYNGTVSFTYRARDTELFSAPATVTVTVLPVNDNPVPVGQSVTTSEDTPLAVTLSATDIDGDPLTYSISVPPTSGSLSGTPPQVTYTPNPDFSGSDSFTFLVLDGHGGAEAVVRMTVTPVNDAPVAAAGDDKAGTVGVAIPLSGAASYDVDGSIASYSWNWGDGTPAGSGVSATHAFAAAGTYTVTLTVTDDAGASATDTLRVTVIPPPVADAGPDLTGIVGQPISFSAASSSGSIVTYYWQWGDSSGSAYDGTPLATHTYTAAGTYTVTLSVRDTAGTFASDTLIVTVNVPPVANAGADQAGNIGQTLSFSGAGSSDPDGSIVSYSWNWGDGTANGSGVSPSHAWAAAGTFTVTLTVTDNGGATATDTLLVTVTAPVNLALNKLASASSTRTKGGTYPAANAVDGSTSTSWMSSKTSSAQWVRVDLGSSRSISNVKVFWPATYYARAFQIQTSTNGTTWTTRFSTTSGNGSPTNAVFGAVSARYVRVNCTTPNNTSYYGVAELEVYQ